MTTELVISYYFPPSDNISGIVLSKRIINNNKQVDVITTSHGESFVDEYVKNRFVVDINHPKDSPKAIFEFIDKAMDIIDNEYESVVSRSWEMSNHFLALEYKFKNPDTYWKAEFSDPLLHDIDNKINTKKKHKIDDEEFFSHVNREIQDLGDFPLLENLSSTFFTIEYLTFLFADEIVFTNANQRDLMLKQFPIDLTDYVFKKSTISPHPSLPGQYYHKSKSDVELDSECINIAYFGEWYYGKRHFESIFYALDSLNHKFKDKIRFYIFISNEKLLNDLKVSDNIIVKKPLDYLTFLNATTKFDILLVNDLSTKDSWQLNPYLPSKVSDYMGSTSDIWAITEKGSSLDLMDLKYKSDIYDYSTSADVLVQILEDRGFVDNEYTLNDDYYVKRLTYLNELLEKSYNKNENLKKENRQMKNKIRELSSQDKKIIKTFKNIKNKL
ncbi:hypothetical protein [Methanobrevibacter sp.]